MLQRGTSYDTLQGEFTLNFTFRLTQHYLAESNLIPEIIHVIIAAPFITLYNFYKRSTFKYRAGVNPAQLIIKIYRRGFNPSSYLDTGF